MKKKINPEVTEGDKANGQPAGINKERENLLCNKLRQDILNDKLLNRSERLLKLNESHKHCDEGDISKILSEYYK